MMAFDEKSFLRVVPVHPNQDIYTFTEFHGDPSNSFKAFYSKLSMISVMVALKEKPGDCQSQRDPRKSIDPKVN